MKIGITGQNGFIGQHLTNQLRLTPEIFQVIDFDKNSFESQDVLDSFVRQCDVIVHLAAMNRHNDPNEIYFVNTSLVDKLIASLNRTSSTAHIIISSSTQEERDNIYGRSKKEGRERLMKWAEGKQVPFTGLIIPNVYGPFGVPYYNSFIATFSHQLANDETPKIENDGEVNLIYVGELVSEIINCIKSGENNPYKLIHSTHTAKVTEVLAALEKFKTIYADSGVIPSLNSKFELNLFNTFRSYLNIKESQKYYIKHSDDRGDFVEIIRLNIGGQVSFSTTQPGVTRGNHYHTRKIERFSVIKGKALIQLRKIGSNEVYDFYLDGDQPSYVDMPIWHTHNIKNIGNDTLYTNFWINEPFNPADTDTYFETV